MYRLTIKEPVTGDTATKEIGSWRDHAREVYASWNRKLPANWGLVLVDTYDNTIELERDNDLKTEGVPT